MRAIEAKRQEMPPPLSYEVFRLLESGEFASVSKAAKRLGCTAVEIEQALKICRIARCAICKEGKWLSL